MSRRDGDGNSGRKGGQGACIPGPAFTIRDHDRVTKRAEYAAAGIEEYWLADPDARTLTVLALDGDRYREHGQFGIGQAATSPLLSELALELAEVFGR